MEDDRLLRQPRLPRRLQRGTPHGLFALLDDVCRAPKPSDEAYLQRIYDEQLGKSRRLLQPRAATRASRSRRARPSSSSTLRGASCYARGFVDKNTDALTVDCELALAHSKHALVAATFAAAAGG